VILWTTIDAIVICTLPRGSTASTPGSWKNTAPTARRTIGTDSGRRSSAVGGQAAARNAAPASAGTRVYSAIIRRACVMHAAASSGLVPDTLRPVPT
jgi:hypothetical protein